MVAEFIHIAGVEAKVKRVTVTQEGDVHIVIHTKKKKTDRVEQIKALEGRNAWVSFSRERKPQNTRKEN